MEVYFYCEYNGCKNSGIPVLFGDDKEFLSLLSEENATAVFVNGPTGDFSGTTLCLGYFDGVHLAHRALFEKAKARGKWGVLLFDRNVKGSLLLTTQYEKVQLISELGADYVIIAEFSEKFMNRTPGEFADFLKDTLNVSAVVAGYDYRFGKMASGDANMLIKLADERNISAEIVSAECENGEPIKSTKIREYIMSGDIPSANRLLGYAYMVCGKVEKGLGNGHKLGFPTANVAYNYEKLLPPDGVYAGSACGKPAVINIGKNPTFNAENRTLEVHLIDFDGDLYGKVISVSFFEKIRDDVKFDTKEALIARIEKDIKFVMED